MSDQGTDPRFRVLICDCEGTNALNAETIAAAAGSAPDVCGTQLCRRELDRVHAALDGGGPVLLGCTQEAPLFLQEAGQAGFDGDLRFVNIREKAGWSRDGAAAGAKMGALIAEARLNVGGPRTVSIDSAGVVLVLGRGQSALEAAQRLGQRMDVTLLLVGDEAPLPPRTTELPVFRGARPQARGHFGAFEVEIADFATVTPSSRSALTFAPAATGSATSQCDILLDLCGDDPLFTAADKRDGYFHPDPRDPAAVARALFDIVDLVGTFEKPRYVAYDPAICVHGRNGIVACTRCIDACPTGAIAPAGDTVEVDPFVCAGCGNCAGACPTGAAAYTMPESEALLLRMRTLLKAYGDGGGRDPVLLLHDGDFGEDMIDAMARHYDGLPANVLPVAVNAAGQCGLETLLAARAFGARRSLVLADPRSAGELDSLQAAAALSAHILEALGYRDGQSEILLTADPEALSQAIWSAAADRPERAAARPEPFHPAGPKRTLLSLALAALHEAAPAPVDEIALPAGAPFGSVDVEVENCTLCMACAGVCPANALRDNPDYPRLAFVESACVQCGLCVKTCPEKVISLQPRLSFGAGVRNPRTVKEEAPFNCVRCGEPFATRSMIETVVQRMRAHSMFADDQALRRLQMCADCRVIDMAEQAEDPLAAGPRPRTRTTDDDLRARARGESDDDDQLH